MDPKNFASILISLPPGEILLMKSIVESYDNLATMRTEDPRRHYLRIYFAPESRSEIEALLDSLSGRFTIGRVG